MPDNWANQVTLYDSQQLVDTGVFAIVRHPLYATLLLTLPPLLIIWVEDLLFLLSWILLGIVAHFVVLPEEKVLLKTFPEEYAIYRKFVRPLIPYKGAGGVRYREYRDRIAQLG